MKLGSSDGTLKGRIIAIVVLTVVSGGSFVLGYMVGRTAGPQEGTLQVERMAEEEMFVVDEPPVAIEPQVVVKEEPPAIKLPAADTRVENATVKKRALKKTSQEHFSVQAGVFGERSYADSFARKLRGKGYSAYIEDSTEEDGTVYKVKVGRFTSREEAAALARKLKESEGVDGFVTGPG